MNHPMRSHPCSTTSLLALVGVWLLSLCQTTLAAPLPQPIHQSVWLEVTPSGQSLVEDNLLGVIEGSGFSLRSNLIPSISYRADTPLTLEQLPMDASPAEVNALTRLRDEIRRWLMGVQIHDPLLQAEIQNLSYQTQFDRLSLKILGRDSSNERLRVQLEIEIPELKVRAERIVARDLNNPWIGPFGLEKLLAQLGSSAQPATISGEFELKVTPVGRIDLSVVSFQTNIGSAPSILEFSPQLIFPNIELIINGQSMKVNPAPIADLVQQQKQALTQSLQKYLETMIHENLPKWISEASRKISRTDLNSALPLPVPEALQKFGVKPNQFLVGYYPDQIGVDRLGSIRLAATTFLEDAFSKPPLIRPNNPKISSPPIFPSSIRHDFAVGIHTAAINRAITVGYEAGLFSNIRLTDKSSISLFLPPKVEIDNRVPPSLIRVQLAIQRANGGFLESLFINKDIKLTFTGFLKVIRNPDSSFSLALNTVDPDSLQIDQNSARLPILLPLIKTKVLQLLRDFNGKLKEKPLMLAAQLKPTEQMLGLKWKLVKLDTEPSTGFITAYFEFLR